MADQEYVQLLAGGDIAYQKAQKLLQQLENSVNISTVLPTPRGSAAISRERALRDVLPPSDSLNRSSVLDANQNAAENQDQLYLQDDSAPVSKDTNVSISVASILPSSDIASEFFQPEGQDLSGSSYTGNVAEGKRKDDLVFASEMAREETDQLALLVRYSDCCSAFIAKSEKENTSQNSWETIHATRSPRQIILETAKQERNTWDLLFYLHEARQYPVEDQDDAFEDEPITHSKTTQQRINVVYRGDVEFQLWHRVTLWLQHVFSNTDPNIYLLRKMSESKLVEYLPKTRDCLIGRSFFPGHNRSKYVSKIDPDAPLRESKQIHPDDEDSQLKLWTYIWSLVKIGAFYHSYSVESVLPDGEKPLDSDYEDPTFQAIELCQQYQNTWLAASLLGGKPEMCTVSNENEQLIRRGNVYRSLWKYTCSALAEQLDPTSTTEAVERDVYSLMAGNMESVLSSQNLTTWLDHCWVYFRCMVQARVDEIAIQHRRASLSKTPNVAAANVDEYENRLENQAKMLLRLDTNLVFEKLQNSNVTTVKRESMQWYHITQAALIKGTFNEVLVNYFCPNFCGEEWALLPHRTIVAICGKQFAEDIHTSLSEELGPFESNLYDPEVADISVDDSPCWSDELGLAQSAPDILRFVAHLVLYLDHFETKHAVIRESENLHSLAVAAIVTAYLRYLIANKQFECIAFFLGDLPKPLCHALFASILESLSLASDSIRTRCIQNWSSGIEDIDLKCMMLQCVRNVRRHWRLNTAASKLVARASLVDQVHIDNAKAAFDSLPAGVSADEWNKLWTMVQCWRWLSFDPSTKLESIIQANCMFRELVPRYVESIEALNIDQDDSQQTGNGQACWKAANELLEMLEEYSEEDGSLQVELIESQVNISGVSRTNVLREFDSWNTYIKAHRSFNNWNVQLSHFDESFKRSAESVKKANALSHQNRAYVIQETDSHRERVTGIVEELEKITNSTLMAMLKVLEFDQGWLADVSEINGIQPEGEHTGLCAAESERELAERRIAMGTLLDPGTAKRICIPILIKIYHHVLITTAKRVEKYAEFSRASFEHRALSISFYKRSLQIADIVADKRYELLRTQTKQQTMELLQKLSDSSKELLRVENTVSVAKG